MSSTCPIAEAAKEIAKIVPGVDESRIVHLARINSRLGAIGFAHDARYGRHRRTTDPELHHSMMVALETIAASAARLLVSYGVEDPVAAFVAEYERAAVKHPGMTLDCDGHTDETRFYALAEEVGEVAASLTYDNAQGTGHNVNTIAEVTQVGALALAWLTRYQDGENR